MSAPAKFAAPVGRLPTIEWVPVADLLIDPAYQRSIETKASRALIATIATTWNWDLVDVLKVSRRPDDSLYVVDGQHRQAAAQMRQDIPQLPCVLKRCTGAAEEARLFVAANRGRKAMSRLDDYPAALGAGDAEAVAIDAIVTAAGLKMARFDVARGGNKPGELACVGAIRTALRKRGEKPVRQAIALMGEAFPDESIANAAALFSALVDLLVSSPGADYDRLFQALLVRDTAEWGAWSGVSDVRGGETRKAVLRDAIAQTYRMGIAA